MRQHRGKEHSLGLNSLVSHIKQSQRPVPTKHNFLNNQRSIKAPFLGLNPNITLPHLGCSTQNQLQLHPRLNPRDQQSGERTNEPCRPSTNRDFGLRVLVWDLVLDLVCVPWVTAGRGAERRRVPAAFNHPPTRLHLHVQPSLHAAHLHVLVQVTVHVALRSGQLHLQEHKRHQQLWKGFFKKDQSRFLKKYNLNCQIISLSKLHGI